MTNQEYVLSLRELADFYEAHPYIKPPYQADEVNYFGSEPYSGAEGMAKFIRDFGGKFAKTVTEYGYEISTNIGGITVKNYQARGAVCKRISDGMQTVKEKVPITFAEVEVEKEVFHWECPEPLLSLPTYDEPL